MKNDYTILIFNNGVLLSVQSPLVCLFDTELHSLNGKRIEELFIPDTIERLSRLETNKKIPFHLCAKSTGCIFNASVEKLKFQKTELIVMYSKENLNSTNSEFNPMLKHTALEQMLSDESEGIYQLIDSMRTTRNMKEIKELKNRIRTLYQKIDDSILKILKAEPIDHYQYESFNFVLTVRTYLENLETKYPDKIWINFQNFFAAYVLGNRERLISLLDDFFLPYLKAEHMRIMATVTQKNDCVVAEFTTIPDAEYSTEISEELTDFSQNEKFLLAKKAGCSVNIYRMKDVGFKMTITYDAYNSYRLYESDTERNGLYEKNAQLSATSD